MADAGAAATPSGNYSAGAARGDWVDDPAQHAALRELDRLHDALLRPARRGGLLGRLLGGGADDSVRGLYLWGGVGRGKTFLIDLFYDSLPLPVVAAAGRADGPLPQSGRRGEGGKQRTHFHRFMRSVHARLRVHAGARDPLAVIAHEWSRYLRVLVLDEFFVNDIGDAMLLGRLLERLFDEGVVLVTSSNTPPGELYKDGLQRARFLPAIAQIQQQCEVVHLQSDTDYRLHALMQSSVYRAPLDAQSDRWLEGRWHALGGDDAHRDAGIELEGRRIPVRARCKGMAWFDFDALCEGPRGSADYIEIAQEFHTVLLGGIPVMDASRDDAARRFVTLVDELYDRHVNLVCSADAGPQALYAGERLVGAFERCSSRLIEMRGADYLAFEHRA